MRSTALTHLATSLGALTLLVLSEAHATVTEPDGTTVVPLLDTATQPGQGDYWDTNRFSAGTLGLQAMFDTWEGAGVINTRDDASSTPATFSPACGLKGAMILRGGSCQVDFGWYCADDPKGAEVIHPLVTGADMRNYHDVVMKTLPQPVALASGATGVSWVTNQGSWYDKYNNNDKGFVPTIQMGVLQPVTGAQSLESIDRDAFLASCPSGRIGFMFKGSPIEAACPNKGETWAPCFCRQSKFSEQNRNQVSTHGDSWIPVLVYPSKKTPGRFYIAFEDLPSVASNFEPILNSQEMLTTYYAGVPMPKWADTAKVDGDFNDFVFMVEGLTCTGGGQPCTPLDPATGNPALGQCAIGSTECAKEGATAGKCVARFGPEPEKCDNMDNDCDGETDEGTGTEVGCAEGEICTAGQCVKFCTNGEFQCPTDKVCDKVAGSATLGYCVESGCEGKNCGAGQACRGGVCVGGCEGVVCPGQQECVSGRCIDLCAGISCNVEGAPDNFVCQRGACVPKCQCNGCTEGLECDTTAGSPTNGLCIDPACQGVTCTDGKICKAGTCVDPCDGVVCSGGNTCVGGSCVPVAQGGSGGSGGGSVIIIAGNAGVGASNNGGGSSGDGSSGSSGANGGGSKGPSCGCRAAGTDGVPAGAWATLGLGALLLLRRRRLG